MNFISFLSFSFSRKRWILFQVYWVEKRFHAFEKKCCSERLRRWKINYRTCQGVHKKVKELKWNEVNETKHVWIYEYENLIDNGENFQVESFRIKFNLWNVKVSREACEMLVCIIRFHLTFLLFRKILRIVCFTLNVSVVTAFVICNNVTILQKFLTCFMMFFEIRDVHLITIKSNMNSECKIVSTARDFSRNSKTHEFAKYYLVIGCVFCNILLE